MGCPVKASCFTVLKTELALLHCKINNSIVKVILFFVITVKYLYYTEEKNCKVMNYILFDCELDA